jgi:hypothetical protein
MRRLPALLLTIATFVIVAVVARTAPAPIEAVFSERETPWMPAVSQDFDVPSTWFCPGVPAEGEGVGGELILVNRTRRPIEGRLTLLAGAGESTSEPITLAGWERRSIDLDEALPSAFVSAVVELEGSGAMVEQRAFRPAGDAVAPCATVTSSQWYVADGFTVDDSVDELVLTNPYDVDAVINLDIATAGGGRSPAEYQGYPVPARSVAVVDLASLGARSEELLAAAVTTSRGRLVVGRSQQFEGGGRAGYTMTLAAPALGDQWWFAVGSKEEDVVETYRLYNPTDEEAEVTAAYLGVPTDPANFVGQASIAVPANSVVRFDGSDIEGLPDGRHAMVFSTLADPSVVVERVITRTVGGEPVTSVSLGAPTRSDGHVASEWYVPRSPVEASENSLAIYNVDLTEATVAIQRITDSGYEPIAGIGNITVPPSGLVTVDLVERGARGVPLVVSANSRVFVERSVPRDGDLGGRNPAWALPLTPS